MAVGGQFQETDKKSILGRRKTQKHPSRISHVTVELR
jgi:hypothetical protein